LSKKTANYFANLAIPNGKVVVWKPYTIAEPGFLLLDADKLY